LPNKILFISSLLFLLFIIAGCDDTLTSDIEIPLEDVSYSKSIQPIFNLKCATSGCHSSSHMAGGYSMQSWSETNTIPYILEGDSENSKLYLIISGKIPPTMPPINSSKLPLTDRERDGIKTWIDEGAKNN